MCFPVAFTTLNHYFVKKRVLAVSLASTLQSIITTMFPMFIQFLMEKYGFRGMLAIVAAVTAHGILGMLVMQPIQWHYKRIQVPLDEDEPCNFIT